MLRTADLEYHLPESRIATVPATPRDAARLMVVSRARAAVEAHAAVRDLDRYLRPGDLLVFNTTRVIPARLVGQRADTAGRVEGLFLAALAHQGSGERWRVLLRAKRVRPGVRFVLFDAAGSPSGVVLTAVERDADEAGAWIVDVEWSSAEAARSLLDRVGRTPLPPYILKAREHEHREVPEQEDRDRYQTVYAKDEPATPAQGSVAAPTAGLHFTPELLARLDRAGVERAEVVLHVGTGTFRPVETETIQQHPMHTETCLMSQRAVEQVRRARAEGRRVIAVGTTSARTLESYARALEDRPGPAPERLDTDLLIAPGWQWRWVDAMLTNFHLPRSTLLAMVGSLLTPADSRDSFDLRGVRALLSMYEEAIRLDYRFYSFGDAMLIA